jgi:hypothetical protein
MHIECTEEEFSNYLQTGKNVPLGTTVVISGERPVWDRDGNETTQQGIMWTAERVAGRWRKIKDYVEHDRPREEWELASVKSMAQTEGDVLTYFLTRMEGRNDVPRAYHEVFERRSRELFQYILFGGSYYTDLYEGGSPDDLTVHHQMNLFQLMVPRDILDDELEQAVHEITIAYAVQQMVHQDSEYIPIPILDHECSEHESRELRVKLTEEGDTKIEVWCGARTMYHERTFDEFADAIRYVSKHYWYSN